MLNIYYFYPYNKCLFPNYLCDQKQKYVNQYYSSSYYLISIVELQIKKIVDPLNFTNVNSQMKSQILE